MTTQEKINGGLLLAVLILLSLFAWGYYARGKADERVLRAAIKAERAMAADSTLRASLRPGMDSLKREIKTLREFQAQQRIKNLLTQKQNENLSKQVDSANAALGLRPRF